MSSENKSPSYLAERDRVRRWFFNSKRGQYALETLRMQDTLADISKVLDDDRWTRFEDIYDEHKDDLLIAASCAEARRDFELRGAASKGSKLLRFFSAPAWYVFRRQIETGEPDYWNDPRTVFWEALRNPQWATVPAWFLRGVYEDMLPKGVKSVVGIDQHERPDV